MTRAIVLAVCLLVAPSLAHGEADCDPIVAKTGRNSGRVEAYVCKIPQAPLLQAADKPLASGNGDLNLAQAHKICHGSPHPFTLNWARGETKCSDIDVLWARSRGWVFDADVHYRLCRDPQFTLWCEP